MSGLLDSWKEGMAMGERCYRYESGILRPARGGSSNILSLS